MNKNDLRYKKTQKLIVDTFLNCVDEIGFEKTTISEICNKAMISRRAFYTHFIDKYDVLEYICFDLKQSYIRSLTQELLSEISDINLRNSVKWNIETAYKHKDVIRVLLKVPNNYLKTILIDTIAVYPNNLLFENYDELLQDVKIQISFNYMTTAMIGFFEIWLNHHEEISLEEAIELMYNLCYYPSSLHQDQLKKHPKTKFKANKNS